MMQFRLQNRPLRNTTELREDSRIIRYDLDMLVESAQRCGEAQASRDVVGENMAIESFAIHCRALVLFLFGHLEGLEAAGRESQKFAVGKNILTDIFAWDYYPPWQHECPVPSEEMYHSKFRADKHVAHITTHRRRINQPGTGLESIWRLNAAVNEICGGMLGFLCRAPKENFDPEQLRAMNTRLTTIIPLIPHSQGIPAIAKSGLQDDQTFSIVGSASTAIFSMQSFSSGGLLDGK